MRLSQLFQPSPPVGTSEVLLCRLRCSACLQAFKYRKSRQQNYAKAQRTGCTRAASCLPLLCPSGTRQLPISKPTLSPRPSFSPTSPCVSVNKVLTNESTRDPPLPPKKSNDHPSFFEKEPQFLCCAPIIPLPLPSPGWSVLPHDCASCSPNVYLPRYFLHCGLWPSDSHPNTRVYQTEAVTFLESL